MDRKYSFERVMGVLGDDLGKQIDRLDLPRLLAAASIPIFKYQPSSVFRLAVAFGAGLIVGALIAPMKRGTRIRLSEDRHQDESSSPWPNETDAVMGTTGSTETKFETRADRKSETLARDAAAQGKLGPV